MRITRMFIAAGFVIILGIFVYCDFVFRNANVPGIMNIEFAEAAKGKEILAAWQNAGLLMWARRLTLLDFAFIFFYVAVIITLSNRQVRKEPSIELNALLRANFFFAVLTGLLDVLENFILLYDMNQVNGSYISSSWVTWLKFIVAAAAVLIWLISFVKSKITS